MRVGDTTYAVFVTEDPDVPGTPRDADALPTAIVYLNGAATVTVVTVVRDTTGTYQASFSLTSATFDDGDYVDLVATYLITGSLPGSVQITVKRVVRQGRVYAAP